MANVKSAKKRILVNKKKADRNKSVKSAVKTSVKKVYAAIEANDKDAAVEALNNFKSDMGKACSKGVYKKNTVSRKISRVSKAVNSIGIEGKF